MPERKRFFFFQLISSLNAIVRYNNAYWMIFAFTLRLQCSQCNFIAHRYWCIKTSWAIFWPKVHVQHVQFTSILQYCKGHFAKPPHSICFIEEWQSGRCNIADQSQGRNIFSRSNTNISSGPNTYPKKHANIAISKAYQEISEQDFANNSLQVFCEYI